MSNIKIMTLNYYKKLFILITFGVSAISCEKALQLDETPVSPEKVFENFWNTLNENYALFKLKNVNWDSVYETTAPQITNNISGDELFKILSNNLDGLKDGHIALIAPNRIYTYDNFYKLYPINFNFKNVEKNYLKNDYQIIGPVCYKIVDSIGYLYYKDFRIGIDDKDLDKIIGEFIEKTKGLIIDVRSNTGGSLANVERLFSRFIKEKTLVKYELEKIGPKLTDFSEKKAFYVSPGSSYYNKPVALLTNRGCFSACNDFVMYMSSLQNVRCVGDQTGGGGAIPFNYILINGWKLQYSATMTLSLSEQPVENGILPDINISITTIQDNQGLDPILEKAFQILR